MTLTTRTRKEGQSARRSSAALTVSKVTSTPMPARTTSGSAGGVLGGVGVEAKCQMEAPRRQCSAASEGER